MSLPRFVFFRVIAALILREMMTRYGKTPGGYVWALIEPVSYIIILSFVFSAVVREPALGDVFPIFFATGVIPFMCYRNTQGAVASAFGFNRNLFTYPQVTLLHAIIARTILQAVTAAVVGTAIFGALFWMYPVSMNIDYLTVIGAGVIGVYQGLCMGIVNCTMFIIAPVWKRVFTVLTSPLFLISGVLFIPESLPPDIREILLINPIAHSIGLFRAGFYSTYEPDYVNYTYILGGGVLLITLGVALIRRYEGYLSER